MGRKPTTTSSGVSLFFGEEDEKLQKIKLICNA
jgi:hypothetical protein